MKASIIKERDYDKETGKKRRDRQIGDRKIPPKSCVVISET